MSKVGSSVRDLIHSWRQGQAEPQGESGCPPRRRNYRFGLNE